MNTIERILYILGGAMGRIEVSDLADRASDSPVTFLVGSVVLVVVGWLWLEN